MTQWRTKRSTGRHFKLQEQFKTLKNEYDDLQKRKVAQHKNRAALIRRLGPTGENLTLANQLDTERDRIDKLEKKFHDERLKFGTRAIQIEKEVTNLRRLVDDLTKRPVTGTIKHRRATKRKIMALRRSVSKVEGLLDIIPAKNEYDSYSFANALVSKRRKALDAKLKAEHKVLHKKERKYDREHPYHLDILGEDDPIGQFF